MVETHSSSLVLCFDWLKQIQHISYSSLIGVRSVLELGLLMWCGQVMFRLFYAREEILPDSKLFYKEVLTISEDTDLENLGSLNTQLVLVLGVAALIVLVLMIGGVRSVGKVINSPYHLDRYIPRYLDIYLSSHHVRLYCPFENSFVRDP